MKISTHMNIKRTVFIFVTPARLFLTINISNNKNKETVDMKYIKEEIKS